MRRLVVLVVVVLGLLLVADRVAVVAAQRDVAKRIEADQHLRTAPHVSINGFPFLTQLVGGTYDDVGVRVRGLTSGKLHVASLDVHLEGVHVSFGDVISQHVSRVPVDRAQARLVLPYADFNGLLAKAGVTLGPGSTGRLAVHDTSIVVSVGNLSLTFPLTGLPFGLHFNAVKATQEGIVVSASANGLVLRP